MRCMTLSVFAYTIGIISLLFGLPQLLFPKETTAWLFRAMEEDVVMRVVGGLFVVLSFLTLLPDHSVGTDVAGLVRLMAWAAGLKGVIICYWPEWRTRIARRVLAKEEMKLLHGVLMITFGVLFFLAGRVLS